MLACGGLTVKIATFNISIKFLNCETKKLKTSEIEINIYNTFFKFIFMFFISLFHTLSVFNTAHLLGVLNIFLNLTTYPLLQHYYGKNFLTKKMK